MEIPSRGARVAVCLAENVGSAIYRQSGNTIYIVCSISVIWISEKIILAGGGYRSVGGPD